MPITTIRADLDVVVILKTKTTHIIVASLARSAQFVRVEEPTKSITKAPTANYLPVIRQAAIALSSELPEVIAVITVIAATTTVMVAMALNGLDFKFRQPNLKLIQSHGAGFQYVTADYIGSTITGPDANLVTINDDGAGADADADAKAIAATVPS